MGISATSISCRISASRGRWPRLAALANTKMSLRTTQASARTARPQVKVANTTHQPRIKLASSGP